ncbi:MAG: glycosyltransferase [Eubacteriales bacterium]|nr:glycosyltransferase [Eubacteriales bacterium]
MNILIVASWYQNEQNPIRGSFFREQAIALKKHGHNVTVATVEQLATHPSNFRRCGKFDEYIDDGIRTIRYIQLSMRSNSHNIGFGKLQIHYDIFLQHNLKGYKKIFNKLKRDGEHFDIIHAHSFYPGGYATCRLKSIFGVPVVVTEHCSIIPAHDLSKKGRKGLEYTVNHANAFNCVSDSLRRAVKDQIHTSKSIDILPNILSSLFSPNKNIEKHSKFTFISVGGLIYKKGMDLLIDAFVEAFDKNMNVQLIIVGDGEQREKLQKQIEDKGYGQEIQLKGRLSREDLASEMNRCHAFALASRIETFGVVYIEAMACGLRTIGTLNGGSNEILNEYGGISIPVDDRKALVKALLEVYNSRDNWDGQASAEKVMNAFNEQSIVTKLESIYTSVISQKEGSYQ